MSSLLLIACLITLIGLALGGFISNAFIVAETFIEWAKSRSLNSSELLLLSLGMSNICCTASVMAVVYWEHFKSNLRDLLIFRAFNILLSIAMLSRFWLNATLCVFYYIKIVNSTHFLFLWCKQRISWLLPWIIVTSVVISILSSVFAFPLVPMHLQSNTTMENTTDIGRKELDVKRPPSYVIFFLVIGSSCPLLVVFLCSIVIVASLYKHVCQMTEEKSSFRSPQTEVHFKAAKTVLFLLFLYLSSFIAQVLAVKTKAKENKITFWLCVIAIMGYSLAQAVILVLVNPKLKRAVTRMLPRRKP